MRGLPGARDLPRVTMLHPAQRHSLAPWLAAALLFFTAGCRCERPQVSELAIDEFASAFSEAFCKQLMRCCKAEEITDLGGSRFSDEKTCLRYHEGLTRQYLIAPLQRAVSEGRARYRPDRAASCLALARRPGCTGWTDLNAIFESCPDLFEGARAAGEPCQSALDCPNEHACLKSGEAKSCVALLLQDAACRPGEEPGCRTDLFCDEESLRCAARKAAGSPCRGYGECKPGLACERSTCRPARTRCTGAR